MSEVYRHVTSIGKFEAIEQTFVLKNHISIITFDDHPYLDYLDYLATPLTCITQPTREICRIAIKDLFFMLTNKEIKSRQVLLKPEVKYRKSIKRIG